MTEFNDEQLTVKVNPILEFPTDNAGVRDVFSTLSNISNRVSP